ncbi:hypothetical protein BLNAU_15745 [Blattamonas nauphoetae]|uniref:Uncharacterized protein n=1 Tax=Blattamonas nauphoetae TaxID=2049346 RepID=A0ABQ9XC62_9EUKA|nr:hypothetical protein BLNAU_15745 [Blattamonas nauphoetae]
MSSAGTQSEVAEVLLSIIRLLSSSLCRRSSSFLFHPSEPLRFLQSFLLFPLQSESLPLQTSTSPRHSSSSRRLRFSSPSFCIFSMPCSIVFSPQPFLSFQFRLHNEQDALPTRCSVPVTRCGNDVLMLMSITFAIISRLFSFSSDPFPLRSKSRIFSAASFLHISIDSACSASTLFLFSLCQIGGDSMTELTSTLNTGDWIDGTIGGMDSVKLAISDLGLTEFASSDGL